MDITPYFVVALYLCQVYDGVATGTTRTMITITQTLRELGCQKPRVSSQPCNNTINLKIFVSLLCILLTEHLAYILTNSFSVRWED